MTLKLDNDVRITLKHHSTKLLMLSFITNLLVTAFILQKEVHIYLDSLIFFAIFLLRNKSVKFDFSLAMSEG